MSETKATPLSNGLRGRGRGRGGHSSHGRTKSAGLKEVSTAPQDLAPPLGPEALLRSKYGDKLALAKELFPDWADEDLLATIDEAHGDLDTAVTRISDGHAQQWSSSTKQRKPKPSLDAAQSAAPSERGAGRGGLRGGRGAGRAGRGGRGGGPGRGGSRSNGDVTHQSNGYGASHDVSSGFTSSSPPGSWADATAADSGVGSAWAADATETSVAAGDAADWGAEPAATTDAGDAGWGDEKPAAEPAGESGWGASAAQAAPVAASAVNKGKAPAARPASRTIQPGAKFSWAQIAKPAEPVKPAPPPVQAHVPTPPPPVPQETQPTIPIPDDEHIAQAAAAQNVDPWASTPAAATEPWEARPLAGVGEGWAETVLAADNERPTDLSALPPTGVDPAGPIELSTTSAQQDGPQSAITANLEAQAAQQQPSKGPLTSVIGPPGLAKRQSQRGDAAVVMPNDQRNPGGALEQAKLQFGSLALYDERDSTADQGKPIEQPQQQSSYAQTAAQQILSPEQRHGGYDQQMQEKAPLGLPAHQAPGQQAPQSEPQQAVHQQQQTYGSYQPFGSYQDPRAAYTSPYAPAASDNSYYNQHQLGHQQQPSQTQQPQAPQSQQQQQYSAPAQPTPQAPSAASPYQPFGSDYGHLGQQQQQQPHQQAPDAQRAPQQPSYDYYAQQYQQAGYPRTSAPEEANKVPSAPSPAVPSSQPGGLPQQPYGAQNQYQSYYPYPYQMYGYQSPGNYGQPGQYGQPAQSGYPQSAYQGYYAGYNQPARAPAYGAPGPQTSYGRGAATSGAGSYQAPQAPSPYSGYAAPGAGYNDQQQGQQAPNPGQAQSSYKDFPY